MTLDQDTIRAVVEGEHGDPFGRARSAPGADADGAAVAVRAIVPGAAAVRVLPADAPPAPMERLDPAGFFEDGSARPPRWVRLPARGDA
jgi:hypothetical protein